ncbi:hypothetical protein PsAD2_04180 [Pseudovibrio axinellae]|uniref:Transposase n=1 Tax=Pseudovibrio axinellae TaxID=989403 RepID=A0A165TXC7_9HYPH|nr:hypothetical protein PsAD2_04180 [Pseudovibrio axinellae]SER84093.1 hypothetical protein SAMN05421798_1338 [Pseudovibrio axinellae]
MGREHYTEEFKREAGRLVEVSGRPYLKSLPILVWEELP